MADRYWVGGTGTWSSTNTTNWSTATGKSITASCATTTLTVTVGTVVVGDTVWSNNHTSLGTITADLGGGNWTVSIGGTFASQVMSAATVGASVPTAADNVFFDANSNSGTTAFTVTMANSPRVCNDFTAGLSPASSLDGVMTLAGTSIGLSVSGSFKNAATNFTRTYTGTTTFNATTTGKTITTNGVAFTGFVSLNGVGGEWTLGSALSTGNEAFSLTAGTFNTANYNITCDGFSSQNNSSVKVINLGSSTIVNTGSFALAGTNLTFNAGTSTIDLRSFSSLSVTSSSATTFYNITAANASFGTSIGTSFDLTIVNLTLQTSSVNYYGTTFSAGRTYTVTGTFTVNYTSTSSVLYLRSTSTTPAIINAASTSFNGMITWAGITAAGAAIPWTGGIFGDLGYNSNITFPAAKNVYWVGGTGTLFRSATRYALSSNGTPSANNYPLPQDRLIFDENSFTADNQTISISFGSAELVLGSIDFSGITRPVLFQNSSSSTNFVNLYGDLIWSNLITFVIPSTNSTQQRAFVLADRNTGGDALITLNGATFKNSISISRNVTFTDTFTATRMDTAVTAGVITLVSGTLNINNQTVSTETFSSSGSSTRSIAFGTGNITCTGTGTVWTTATSSGLTTTGTQVVNVTSTGSTAITVTTGTLSESNSISFNFTGGTYALGFLNVASNTARNVDFTGFAGTLTATSSGIIYGNLKISSGMTLTAAGSALSFSATSGTQLITTNGKTLDFPITFSGLGGTRQLQDAMTVGSTRTTTLTSGTLNLNDLTLTTGLFSSANSNTRTIAFGTGNITCTGTGTVWTTATVTNLTTTGTQVVNVTSTGSTAITVATGALSEANSISYNFTGGTYALNFLHVTNYSARNVDFTGYAGTLAELSDPSAAPVIIYGDLTLSAGMTLTASPTGNGIAFRKTSGTSNITTNGKALPFILNFNGVGGTFVLQDALTVSGATSDVFLTNGTLDLNGKTFTLATLFQINAGTKNLTFNGGTLVCPLAVAIAFYNIAPTGFTTTAGTGTGTISMTAAGSKGFVGGGSIYNCTLNQGGAGALTIFGSNTFSNITNTYKSTGATSILFTAGDTNTFTNWNASGESGRLLTIGSTTAASHTLSKASGTVSSDFLSISRSTATGGAGWYAGANSTDGGNNSGWIFTAPPAPPPSSSNSNFLVFF